MKKVAVLLLIGVTSLSLLTGCEEDEAKSVSNNNGESSKKEEIKTVFSQKESVEYQGVLYTVTKVEKSTGNDWDKPDSGKEFVIITIKIENKSDKKISYNTLDWKMQNSQGQEDDETFTTINNETALNSGDLVSGGTKEGTIVFEEPTGDSTLVLNYYPNVFDSNYAFQIKLD